MGIVVKRENLKRIDLEKRVVEFDPETKHGKITGSRFLAVLGRDKFMSDFKAACLIARVFYDDTKTVFTEAGEIVEPIMRGYARENRDTILAEILELDAGEEIKVEEPVDKRDCYFDHFRKNKVFGGLVDGFITVKGRRYAILEIKTTSNRSDWFDEEGNHRIPEGYYLQASLYAQLSGLDRIVFAVAFLEGSDYENPEAFVPRDDNTLFLAVDKKDITEEMAFAEEWFRKYIDGGVTPEWTDADAGLIDVLTSERIKEMPGDAMLLFKKYVKHMDSDEDLSDIEYNLKEIMSSAAVDGVSKVVYEQDGVTFTLSLDRYRLTVTRN